MHLAYYNEFDPKAAAWLGELILAGHIAPGIVDTRSITDVTPSDLAGFTQCHFFAGVGGWSIAARLAGWPDDRAMWSASCPCQPFSVAGKGAGAADARHLWPDFFRLVRARRPTFIVGEQVAAAVGKDWFLGVRSDLESIGYVGRGVVVPACAVNAPHRRDRLWFVAGSRLLPDAAGHGDGSTLERGEADGAQAQRPAGGLAGPSSSNGCDVDHTHDARPQGHPGHEFGAIRRQEPSGPVTAAGGSDHGRVSDAQRERVRGSGCAAPDGAPGAVQGIDGQREWVRPGGQAAGHGDSLAAASGTGAWDGARWLISHDGKARRVEPGIPLLVDGLPNRAPLLRGYGNAIVPQLAAEVIAAWMDVTPP